MRILAIESSGRQGSVALLDGDRVQGETVFETGMVHGRDIAPGIEALLRVAGLPPGGLDLVAVDIGPGSYTGLRVGLAAAKGLCLALGKPLAGVVSLDALAAQLAGRAKVVVPAFDAKWDQVYGALYEGATRTAGPFAEPPAAFAARVPAGALVAGDALEKSEALFAARGAVVAPRRDWFPRASTVGRLAAASGARLDPATAAPLYLRKTEAELKRT